MDFAASVNILGKTEVPLEASKEADLEVNSEKTKYMFCVLSPECRTES
jgi:hypothetical protein